MRCGADGGTRTHDVLFENGNLALSPLRKRPRVNVCKLIRKTMPAYLPLFFIISQAFLLPLRHSFIMSPGDMFIIGSVAGPLFVLVVFVVFVVFGVFAIIIYLLISRMITHPLIWIEGLLFMLHLHWLVFRIPLVSNLLGTSPIHET
jgi:hypothetical protein